MVGCLLKWLLGRQENGNDVLWAGAYCCKEDVGGEEQAQKEFGSCFERGGGKVPLFFVFLFCLFVVEVLQDACCRSVASRECLPW